MDGRKERDEKSASVLEIMMLVTMAILVAAVAAKAAALVVEPRIPVVVRVVASRKP